MFTSTPVIIAFGSVGSTIAEPWASQSWRKYVRRWSWFGL
jgi:hypothetical protein